MNNLEDLFDTSRIRVVVEGEYALIYGPFLLPFLKVLTSLSGRKIWNSSSSVKVEANPANIRKLRECDFDLKFEDRTGTLKAADTLETLPTQTAAKDLDLGPYEPGVSLRKHQRDTLSISADRKAYAHLHDMGLGKTAIIIAEAGILYTKKKITGVLVLAPKGVHRQWIEEQLPEHIDKRLNVTGIIWKGKSIDIKEMKPKGLTYLSMNIDAIRTEKGFETADNFLKLHSGSSLMVVDESHLIKSWNIERTRAAWKLGERATYRRILTGTPIAKNILDAWSQFKFLNPSILGHKYITSFRARYCIMGGWEGRQVLGAKNTEEFYRLIAPHSFRLTRKEALDLPPKIYAVREYEMSPETLRHYKEMKNTFMTGLDDGSIVDVPNALVCLLRLQQILCGYLPSGEAGRLVSIGSNERIDAMLEIVKQVDDKVIVWARFIEDGHRITAALEKEFGEGSTVLYRGTDKEKATAKREFIFGRASKFVANPASGGTGTDGLQKACSSAIYYSNSFNSLDRWQSEDRIDRMGSIGTSSYFDLVATKSVDRAFLANLRHKKSVSDLTLDQIRQAIIG